MNIKNELKWKLNEMNVKHLNEDFETILYEFDDYWMSIQTWEPIEDGMCCELTLGIDELPPGIRCVEIEYTLTVSDAKEVYTNGSGKEMIYAGKFADGEYIQDWFHQKFDINHVITMNIEIVKIMGLSSDIDKHEWGEYGFV